MSPKKILIAYGSWTGSTGDIAKVIGDILRDNGMTVDVVPAKEVRAADGYDAMVIGSAVRMGMLHRSVKGFVSRNRKRLSALPVALFSVSMTMKDDTPKNRETAAGYLKPLLAVTAPVATGHFAGAMDIAKLNFFFRWISSKDKTGAFKTEDARDYGKVRAWAREMAEKLSPS